MGEALKSSRPADAEGAGTSKHGIAQLNSSTELVSQTDWKLRGTRGVASPATATPTIVPICSCRRCEDERGGNREKSHDQLRSLQGNLPSEQNGRRQIVRAGAPLAISPRMYLVRLYPEQCQSGDRLAALIKPFEARRPRGLSRLELPAFGSRLRASQGCDGRVLWSSRER